MPHRRLVLITVPSMIVLPLRLMQVLHQSGREIVTDPLNGIDDVAARADRLAALVADADRVLLLPAASLYALPALATLGLQDSQIVMLDSADPARAALRALRNEAWMTEARSKGVDALLPIPDEAKFRISVNANRFNNLIHEVQIGRTILDAALRGISPRRIAVDCGDEVDLDIPDLPPLPAVEAEPFSALTEDPEATVILIRNARIASPGVVLPPLPGITQRASSPVMAFVCGRNVSSYLSGFIKKYLDEGIPLIYIDNGSDDGSAEIAAGLVGRGIAELHHLPYDGSFSVEAQLRLKQKLIAHHAPRWVLNMDADEIPEHRDPGASILDMTRDAERHGYNALNFNEFVFLPRPGEDHGGQDYARDMRHYYFFEPMPYRLIRMWRHGLGLSNLDSAGHRLSGPLRVAPVSHNLRHYIALSQQAARQKYVGRRFAAAELARNWHRNRTGLTEDDIRLPDPGAPQMRELPQDDPKAFDRSQPLKAHWWQWPRP